MAKIKRKATEPEVHNHAGELEGIDDIGSPEDEEWASLVRAWNNGEELKAKGEQGNISGLAKHLSKKYGGDPHLFTNCMGDEALASYTQDAAAAICAKAHYLALGYWPGDKRNEQKKTKPTFILDESLKAEPEIVIDTEENDDWMKKLPGYKDEQALHEELAAKLAKKGKLRRRSV